MSSHSLFLRMGLDSCLLHELMSRKRGEEHGLDSRCASNVGKMATNVAFWRWWSYKHSTSITLHWYCLPSFLFFPPMAFFCRLLSSFFQTNFPCERGEGLINGGVSSPMDGQTSQPGEGFEACKACLEISQSLHPLMCRTLSFWRTSWVF